MTRKHHQKYNVKLTVEMFKNKKFTENEKKESSEDEDFTNCLK
jgi:hypothetical protein